MPQTPSVAGSGSRWASQTDQDHPRQATTFRTKSRLTVRLPDVSKPRDPSSPADRLDQTTKSTAKSQQTESSPASTISVAVTSVTAAEAARKAVARLTEKVASFVRQRKTWQANVMAYVQQPNGRPQKFVAFVRQPKVWLSCIAAIAVQVVLATIMTPAEEDAPLPERPRSAAKALTKSAPTPATRIVVPPAVVPSDVSEPTDAARNSMTTPLGPTGLPEEAIGAGGPNGHSLSGGDRVDETIPPTRMAENRRLTDDGRQFDGRPAARSDGATLGGIVPLESSPEPNTYEPRR